MLNSHDGGAIHLTETGNGPPVLLLHGVTLQWWVWSAVIRLLSEDHRVFAWDMRGHGQSVAGTDGVTMEAIATDIHTVLTSLQITGATVVGHSMGGMALGRFPLDHPDTFANHVSHLCFVATSSGPLVPTGPMHPKLVRSVLGYGSGWRYPWADSNLSRTLLRWAFGAKYSARSVEDLRVLMSEVSNETMDESLLALALFDITEGLEGVNLPATVVTGTSDRVTPMHHGVKLAELVDGDMEVVHGIGHQVMQEDPHLLSEIIRAAASRRERRP